MVEIWTVSALIACNMNYVSHTFRNVINPWQTPKEIDKATMYVLKMMDEAPHDDWDFVLNTDNSRVPYDRDWEKAK